MSARIRRRRTSFGGDESGAALVEFAITLPLLLLLFAFIVEGGRVLRAHQMISSGVRDAARYVGRAAPTDICAAGGDLSALQAEVENLVRSTSIAGGAATLPGLVTVSAVTPTLACVGGLGLRLDPTPIATVVADVTIELPLSALFTLFGEEPADLVYQIANQTRIYGE